MMKTMFAIKANRALLTAAGLLIGAANLLAQNGPPQGDFDPAQMRQRIMERIREALDVKEDTEWQAVSERIAKVMDARRAARGPGGPGGLGRPGGAPPPGGAAPREGNGPGSTDAAPGAGGP